MTIRKPPNGYTTSYDLMYSDCPRCKSGRHYQVCRKCKDRVACAGFAHEGEPNCCECGEVKETVPETV